MAKQFFLMHSLTIKCNPLVDALNVMSSVCFSCRKSLICKPPIGIVTWWICGALPSTNVLGVMSATTDKCLPPTNNAVVAGPEVVPPVSSIDALSISRRQTRLPPLCCWDAVLILYRMWQCVCSYLTTSVLITFSSSLSRRLGKYFCSSIWIVLHMTKCHVACARR